MGLNISGLIINKPLSKEKIENLLDADLDYSEDVDFDEATTSFKEDSVIDIHQSEKGTIVFTDLGNVYDVSNYNGEIIQFIISDVSGTYYFEKYVSGNLERKLILTDGEIAEEFGKGIVSETDDFTDIIFNIINEYTGTDITEVQFKRHEIFNH